MPSWIGYWSIAIGYMGMGCIGAKDTSAPPKDDSIRDTGNAIDSGVVDTSDTQNTDTGISIDTNDTSDTQETGDTVDTSDTTDTSTEPPPPDCYYYNSTEEEYAPIQIVASPIPSTATQLQWHMPTAFTSYVNFSGSVGQEAHHEGIDYIHSTQNVGTVPVFSASQGTVVYVRTGCPQSTTFTPNTNLRECGSGWGNHVVIDHGNHFYTRYAHLSPNSVLVVVGDVVTINTHIANMGNSGRSDVRHLHMEMGTSAGGLDPCLPAQSFDVVYDPIAIPDLDPN